MLNDLDKILISEDQIKSRVKELASELYKDYGPDEEITVISIINGAILFTADLVRNLPGPVRIDCIRVSSYGDETTPIGEPKITSTLSLDLKGRHVLLVDDIFDTGNTISKVYHYLEEMQPTSIKTCVLLEKKARRIVEFEVDWVGFQIPDEFVVGYGLDYAQRYRNLRCIGVLKTALQPA
jgi:hypoxanthine phosphoribosyltransferase